MFSVEDTISSVKGYHPVLLRLLDTWEGYHIGGSLVLWAVGGYLVGPFYAGPNLTPALLTPALIPPPQESALTPFRAAFYAGQRPRKEKIQNYILQTCFIL